ncbi:MAG: hypothetical protein C0609_05225 [Deltaproteobacteria bacterium]|nr:MAG: hypothetical protein C0609_05225 [Deltaproteobacteria bacterium]
MRIAAGGKVYISCPIILIILLLFGISGCGDTSGRAQPDGITMGEVEALMSASNGVDSDSDFLPDDVEIALGTDPNSPDSDRDGLFDYGEIFSGDYSGPGDLVPNWDEDDLIAALDDDDNGDGLNDGEEVDSDGDGIPNYLEYYGYTYNWVLDEYNLWNGDTFGPVYYKTDPMQPSTDQDPYSDGMEASGVLMDVLVNSPGDLPMVPAYPNIVVRLEGYDITLDSEISYSHGGSLSRETSWSRQASVESAFEAGISFEVGAEAKVGATEWLTLSTKAGLNFSATQTVSSTRSFGESITRDENWQKAVSSNPATAARVKLKLKVYNFGTAAASNIIPTLTMKIGGMSVLTFTPDTPIEILGPGGVYPSSEGTYWVVDKTSADAVIYLTMDELRAIESGTPLNIEVTQMDGEVMLLDGEGQWSSAGKWAEYMARCEAVCANIKLDIGDGNFIHQLVYADDSPFTPEVTLGDALTWIANYEERDGGGYIQFVDRYGMVEQSALADWNFIFDRQTLLENNLLPPPEDPEEAVSITDIVLNQNSVIIARAPRETLEILTPEVYYAYYDVEEGLVHVRAGDYNGITNAYFVDVNGEEFEMFEVLPNSGVFVFDAGSLDGGTYEPTYFSEGLLEETVRVVNRDGDSVQERLSASFLPTKPDTPIDIVSVSIDELNNMVVATISSDPYFPPTKVAVYIYGEEKLLEPHPMNWHPDYKGKWIYDYGGTSYIPADFINSWVIAEVGSITCDNEFDPAVQTDYSSDCFATYQVEESDIAEGSCISGGFTLNGYTSLAVFSIIAKYDVVDFDVGPSAGVCSSPQVNSIQEDIMWSGFSYGPSYDLAVLAGYGGAAYADLEARYGVYKITDRDYEEINAGNIRDLALVDSDPLFFHWSVPGAGYSESYPNSVWILKTNSGRYVKLLLNKAYGTGYAVHTTHHIDISYAVYDFTQ